MHRGTKILGMKPHRLLLTIHLAACLVALAHAALAQGTSSSQTPNTGIVLTKLSPPVYPPLARQARIMGDVSIRIGIQKDGSVVSAEVISGHPMLKQAALESAQKSTFECRTCSEEVTPYSLTYTFAFRDDGDCCNGGEGAPVVTQLEGHVTIAAAAQCICDPSVSYIRVRAAKCLYLWKCGLR
jgi:TonB family protein